LEKNERIFLIKVLKSLVYTFAMVIVSMIGIYGLVNLGFTNMSAEQSNTWIIISLCIGIFFAIFFCMFTILDEIKKKG
jgi:hypothetical protein